ncbi:MAG TPA: D-glycerate dehydrogenase [Brevundimonas sp.]|jgi:glyoxylate reductase|uniref:2-hydroxyacid dehydrogenase n=1 Tax=Brevundimonas sp. TaxID=1871086 RepID=UPI002DF38965|nr:D-glycerate dehydrogenase [Brevundimonas sp.]
MSARSLKVTLTRRLPDAVETRMRELFDARLNLTDRPMSRQELAQAMASSDVLVPTITDRVDAELIDGAPDTLKMIANFGAGTEHVDVAAAQARGILVTNTPGVLTEDTADLAMTLILAVSRRVVEGAEALREGRFEGWTPTWMMGRKLWGKRLGIVGMGRIGQALARRARAFGLQVHYHNRRQLSAMIEEELGVTWWDDLDAMLPRMDVISLNTPATAETRHIVSAERLSRLQPHAILVNTARGELIDEAALARALIENRLGGAGLDVFEHEPAVHPDLLRHPRAVLLPHLGSATVESRQDMGDRVILNVMTFANGHRPPDRVLT